METDDDLPSLIAKQDHVNVLKYVRVHKLRQPELVVQHGTKVLGWNDDGTMTKKVGAKDLTVVEQVCLSALDCQKFALADRCLQELERELDIAPPPSVAVSTNTVEASGSSGTSKESFSSVRYQLLRGRYHEAKGEMNLAKATYDRILEQNPACNLAWKRQYCLHKSMPDHELERIQCLNDYINLHSYNDSSAWYELFRQYQEIGHWENAIYCLHHVLCTATAMRSADTINLSMLHCELAECYMSSCGNSTSGPARSHMETIIMARKHMACALELNPSSLRAKFGLVSAANRYLVLAADAEVPVSKQRTTTKDTSAAADVATNDDFERKVSQELVKYGAEQIVASLEDGVVAADIQTSIRAFLGEYTNDLE
jgi:tetratricopeptide (TPR) repeat protein